MGHVHDSVVSNLDVPHDASAGTRERFQRPGYAAIQRVVQETGVCPNPPLVFVLDGDGIKANTYANWAGYRCPGRPVFCLGNDTTIANGNGELITNGVNGIVVVSVGDWASSTVTPAVGSVTL